MNTVQQGINSLESESFLEDDYFDDFYVDNRFLSEELVLDAFNDDFGFDNDQTQIDEIWRDSDSANNDSY